MNLKRTRPCRFLKNFLPAAILTVAISFLVALYGPMELYFTNIHEFRYDVYLLFPELMKLFGLMVLGGLLCFGVCYVVYIRLYQSALVAALIGYLCTYIQGMFFSGHLPPLDGQKIRWQDYGAQNLQSLILWLVVGMAVVLLVRFFHTRRLYQIASICGGFLSAVLVVTLVTVGIQYDGFQHKTEAIMSRQEMFTMSEDENLVIFVVDALDSATFSEMIKENGEFADTLTDFTYYPNTVGAYAFTRHSIPYILTGQWYENQEDFFTFTTRAMDTSPLLTTLEQENYRMGIYEEELIYRNDNVYKIENAVPAEYQVTTTKDFLKEQIKLVWFKYAPFPVKKLVKVDMQRCQGTVQLKNRTELFSPNNQEFYAAVQDARVEKTKDKCFRFIHIEGAHVPFRYDAEVNLIDEEQGSYEQNVACSMTIVKAYLQLLKDAGVYDNSAIIIMADHGYGNNKDVPIIGRGNPFLAVKGIGEQHPFAGTDAPISYEDLQEAYGRLLEGKTGDEIFDAREGDQRNRRFLYYFYQKEHKMEEYQQTGHAFDITTMVPTGEIYVP